MTQPPNAAVTTSQSRALAERLLAFESDDPDLETSPGFRVCDKLRLPLSTLMGTVGYRALITRALTLAKRDSKLLESVRVREEGALEYVKNEALPAGNVLARQLIALLLSFVGEAVTLRLLHDVWPALRGPNTTAGEME